MWKETIGFAEMFIKFVADYYGTADNYTEIMLEILRHEEQILQTKPPDKLIQIKEESGNPNLDSTKVQSNFYDDLVYDLKYSNFAQTAENYQTTPCPTENFAVGSSEDIILIDDDELAGSQMQSEDVLQGYDLYQTQEGDDEDNAMLANEMCKVEQDNNIALTTAVDVNMLSTASVLSSAPRQRRQFVTTAGGRMASNSGWRSQVGSTTSRSGNWKTSQGSSTSRFTTSGMMQVVSNKKMKPADSNDEHPVYLTSSEHEIMSFDINDLPSNDQLLSYHANNTGDIPDYTNSGQIILRTHTQQTKQCKFCGRYCASPAALSLHLHTHTGERPYKCSICNKAFSQPGSLDRHMTLHTGIKPFLCDVCGKRFARKDKKQYHISHVHKNAIQSVET